MFDVITRSRSTREKRLLIDLSVLGDAYHTFGISHVCHTMWHNSPFDAPMKVKCSPALDKILDAGALNLVVNHWIVLVK